MTKITVMKNNLVYSFFIFVLCAAPIGAVILPIGWGPVNKTSISSNLTSFPEITGMNLEGDKFHLPQDFSAKHNIVIVAFKRKHQADVNTWLDALGGWVETQSDIALYELPVLKKFSFWMRFNINNGMRYGIDSKSARARTVTVYLDKEEFRERMGIVDEESIHTLVLDEQGRITWRAGGVASSALLKDLKSVCSSQ